MAKQPIKFLEGEKVYLRPYEPEDVNLLYPSLYNAEGRRLTGTQQVFSRATTADFVAKVAEDKSRLDLVICSQDSNQAVGEVVLNSMDFYNRSANIRIGLFDEQHYGKGYGSEAIGLMLNHAFGFFNLHRVELGVFEFNERAIHVYEKLGFKREGVLRDSLYYDHKYHDQIMMSILEADFRQLHRKVEEAPPF